jgi:hypothetical protein
MAYSTPLSTDYHPPTSLDTTRQTGMSNSDLGILKITIPVSRAKTHWTIRVWWSANRVVLKCQHSRCCVARNVRRYRAIKPSAPSSGLVVRASKMLTRDLYARLLLRHYLVCSTTVSWSNFDRQNPKMGVFLQSTEPTRTSS